MTYEIYGLHNGDGNIRYVGQTSKGLNKRLSTHKTNARKPKTPSQFWIQKHNYAVQIVLLETADDLTHANLLEKFWIAQYRDIGVSLLNVTDGGDGTPGAKHTAESLANMSAALTGRTLSEEHRANIAKSQKRPRTEKELAHYAKMREAKRQKKSELL